MKRIIIVIVGALLILLIAGQIHSENVSAKEIDKPEILSLDVLNVLSPLGKSKIISKDYDQTLANFLIVDVCKVTNTGCNEIRQFNSQKTKGGLDYIKFRNKIYHFVWKLDKKDINKEFRISFHVAGIDIGQLSYIPKSARSLPVRFQIKNNPRIRARVLHEQGYSATEIAQWLLDEFNIEQDELLTILTDEGFTAYQLYLVLVEIYSTSVIEAEQILYNLGYSPEEFLEFTTVAWISRFAPVLKFDGAHKGLPMSAQVYYETILDPSPDNPSVGKITWTTPWDGPCGEPGVVSLCARDECTCGMENNDFTKLQAGEIPTYYKVISDIDGENEGRLRIAYWWFYGFQPPCSYVDGCPGADGSHHGDWENIIITTSPDREQIDYVTYYFHGDWYTRSNGGYYVYPDGSGERPVVFVGKLAHGSYHNQEHSGWMAGTPHHCCEYADYRNPTSTTIWDNLQDNLVSLRGNSESWMVADKIGSYYEFIETLTDQTSMSDSAPVSSDSPDFRYDSGIFQISDWRWGPHISYCDWWLFGCMDWEHNYAVSTHPTNKPLNWDLKSCDAEGCGDTYCEGLIYDANGVYFNQPWPWD